MASKLSINNVHADMMLAQIKTGEFFTVQMVDLVAKKVTIADASGEEKVVSKATLERWYRELTDDELQKFSESEKAEQGAESTDGNENDANAENEANTNEAGSEGVPETESGNVEDTNGETAGVDGEFGESIDERGGSDAEQPVGNGGANNESVGDDGGDDTEQPDVGVASPITPSNAGKDKDKSKEQKKQEPKNAALMKVRQTIIDTILADSPSIQLKKTTSYDVLKEKHNFAEITHGSNRFNVSVMSKCLTEDQLNKVKVNPASFGWSIDADFTVFDEGDIEMAVQLIRQSREYRLANPVTRKKKEKK